MINDIKAKLPFKKKVEDEELDDNEDELSDGDATDPSMGADKTGATEINDIDEEEEVDEPQSLIDKIKAKLIPKKKKASSEDDIEDEEDETGKKKAPKKKINPVILLVVVGGLAFLFFGEEEQPAPEPDPAAMLKNKQPKRPTQDAPATTDTPADKPAEPQTPAVTDSPADTAAETPTETPSTTDTPSIDMEPAPSDVATTETPVDAEPVEPSVTEDIPVVPEPADEPMAPVDEPMITDEPSIPGPESIDSVDGQITDTDESSMTDKILEDLEKQVRKDQPKEVKKEYVAPPDYEYRGRGLVYNCTGKHWACVDGPSYKICEDNFSSSTYQKKPIECYPFNVYETTKGCELMQNRVVSSNAKTNFCKGN